ncbi:MAG TPA: hypothetical protein VF665_13600 [Longimicrobium sp.]|jgi:hypothetical protein|uniref:hypothetical protein n=1 Tax=Longimicrobium sp. TaxID=2029185 RepID=UPI002EDAC7B0
MPQELIDLIFQFLTVREVSGIMHVAREFRAAGIDTINEVLRRNGVRLTAPVGSLQEARRALTRPLGLRLTDLYATLTSLELYLRGEEWNLSGGELSRFHPSSTRSGFSYAAGYLPLTLAYDHPARATTHFSAVTPDQITNARGEKFNLGEYLTYWEKGRWHNDRVMVDVLDLLEAIRALIAWLRPHRRLFLTLRDGTQFG